MTDPAPLTAFEGLANALYCAVVQPDTIWWDDLTPEMQAAWLRAAKVAARSDSLDAAWAEWIVATWEQLERPVDWACVECLKDHPAYAPVPDFHCVPHRALAAEAEAVAAVLRPEPDPYAGVPGGPPAHYLTQARPEPASEGLREALERDADIGERLSEWNDKWRLER